MIKFKTIIVCGFLLFAGTMFAQEYTLTKIWDAAPHNAFTDLIEYGGKYYCCSCRIGSRRGTPFAASGGGH
jgi:hypothetical protein